MKLNVVADFLQRDESRWLYVCRSLSQNQQQLHAIKIWHIFCPNSKKLYLPYFCQLYDLINGFGIHNLTEESGFDLPKCQFGLVFWDLQTRSNCSTLTRLLWITFKGVVILFCSDGSNNVWRLMFDHSKPKIWCSSSIANRWTSLSAFDVQKMMFQSVWWVI